MPARLAQQDDENGMMEAACPQAVSAGLANSDGVGAPRLHPRYFLGSSACLGKERREMPLFVDKVRPDFLSLVPLLG